MTKLHLHIPNSDELWYRVKLLSDPKTMDYNKGYNLGFPEYNNATGCIAFPKSKWNDWYNWFIGNEPERYYAYISLNDSNEFIGEVNLNKNSKNDWYDMGIIIEDRFRGKGYSSEALRLLLSVAFDEFKAVSVHNDFEKNRLSAVKTHLSVGFKEIGCANGIIELAITRERYYLNKAISKMTSKISSILSDCVPSIYLYGSVALNDFKLGWSDIDILCLTQKSLSQAQAEKLVNLRQQLLDVEPNNPYYRLFEGGFLSLNSLVHQQSDKVVYWGTSGEKITDSYRLDSFSTAELLDNGILLYGDDVRENMRYPTYEILRDDILHHYEMIRKYAIKVGVGIKSYGWLLDISRCIYTLRTGKNIAKTIAGEWALEQKLCIDREALETAVMIRREPLKYKDNNDVLNYTEKLGSDIQRYADVLEKELKTR